MGIVSGKKVTRRVTQTNGGLIKYFSSGRKGIQSCWISTWIDWCKLYDAKVIK